MTTYRSGSFLTGLLLFMGTTAHAQPAMGTRPAYPPEGRPGLIFISPAGEPFRASTGDYPSRTWFDQADSKSDGRLTAVEMIANGDGFFRQLDESGDGRIDGAEVRRYESVVAPEIRVSIDPGGGLEGGMRGGPSSGGARGPGGSQPERGPPGGSEGANAGSPGMSRSKPDRDMPRGGGRFSLFNIAHPVLRADTDLSGSITLNEFRAWQREQFVALDVQRKGYVMFEELPRTPMQSRGLKLGKPRGMRR